MALTPSRVASTSSRFAGGSGTRWGVGEAPGTLLGPEGSGESLLRVVLDGLSDPHCGRTATRSAPGRPCLGCGGGVVGAGCVGGRPFFENCTVDASIFVAQVFKGTRWMPWHQEPMKGVGICDKPRGVDNQTVIRGFPNGETRLEASPVTLI